MTKYKALFRAVQHLTVADYQLNNRVPRRAGHRMTEPYGKNAARRIDSTRAADDRKSGLAFLNAEPGRANAASHSSVRA